MGILENLTKIQGALKTVFTPVDAYQIDNGMQKKILNLCRRKLSTTGISCEKYGEYLENRFSG